MFQHHTHKGGDYYMNKSKLIALCGIAAMCALLVYVYSSTKRTDESYIFTNTNDYSTEDARLYFKSIVFDSNAVQRYFSGSVANSHTVKFFKSLQRRFRNMNLNDHLDAVHEYLRSIMDAEKADETFALYKKYTHYEMDAVRETSRWRQPKTPRETIAYLRRLQDFRNSYFGPDVADALFGLEGKIQEYSIRRGAILHDKNAYGAEKESNISRLNSDMWGTNAESLATSEKPYDQYTEKLQLYRKDLAELSDDERRARIREYQKEYFSDDILARFDDIDKETAVEREKENMYAIEEQKILSDPRLDENGKRERIERIQNEIFGDDAESFRRRETIRGAEENKLHP